MHKKGARIRVVGVDFIKNHDAVPQAPESHKIVPHRENRQDGLIDRSNTILRKKSPFLVCEPFTSADLAARFAADAEIQGLLSELQADPHNLAPTLREGYSPAAAARLAALNLDRVSHARKGRGYEKLDQLVTELLLGVR